MAGRPTQPGNVCRSGAAGCTAIRAVQIYKFGGEWMCEACFHAKAAQSRADYNARVMAAPHLSAAARSDLIVPP